MCGYLNGIEKKNPFTLTVKIKRNPGNVETKNI